MIKYLLDLLYPEFCIGCDRQLQTGEEQLCTFCRIKLPETNFHRYNDPNMQKVFEGRIPIENATALFHFEKKGPVQKILHNLKYRGQETISTFLGNWLGHQLSQSKDYKQVDCIIPVPIHPKKRKIRGYNQVSGFAQALATHLQCFCEEEVLLKSKNTQTQVFKNKFKRSDEIHNAFSIQKASHLENKHILLVDDLLTTGATLEACGKALLEIPNIKLSIATMAIAN